MKSLKPMIAAATVLMIGGGLYLYWQHTAAYPSSDDSYLQAGIIKVAPQTSGTVESVTVAENQMVQAGDVLFTINTNSLKAAVQAAEAQLDQARQGAQAAAANLAAAQAKRSSALSARTSAQSEFDRQDKLAKDGAVSGSSLDQARAALNEATANMRAADASVHAARATTGDSGDDNAGIRAALANLTMANLNLSHATVTAPTPGWISNFDLRPGQFVSAGQAQFAIVANDGWWIEANFKETDLTRIRPGMPATISVDMYPSLSLTGTVDSIGAGSGASFSLLPAQNATGNWVKVTQRFPVRIRLTDAPADPDLQLRVGASTTVQVDTTQSGQ